MSYSLCSVFRALSLSEALSLSKPILLYSYKAPSLQGSTLEWYTFELSNFNRNMFNNDPGMKYWVNILPHYFKIPINIVLGLFINEIYSVNDTQA